MTTLLLIAACVDVSKDAAETPVEHAACGAEADCSTGYACINSECVLDDFFVNGSAEGEPQGGGGTAIELSDGNCFSLPVPVYSVTGYSHGDSVPGGKYHAGDDVDGDADDPVFAIFEGTVYYADYANSWGTLVEVRHTAPDGTDFYTIYGHLGLSDLAVRAGEQVSQGDLLGYLGTSEENGGWVEHLHYSIYSGTHPSSGVLAGHVSDLTGYEDPIPWMEAHGSHCAGQTITVTSPTNSDTWYYDEAYSIRWSTEQVEGNLKVEVYKGSSFFYQLAANDPNDGALEFVPVEALFGEACDYYVCVSTTDESAAGCSEEFCIGSEPEGLTVLWPGGGEELVQDTSYSLEWAPGDVESNIKLEIYKGGSFYYQLAANDPNDGTAEFTPVASLFPEGADYQLCIAATDGSANACGEEFSIRSSGGVDLAISTSFDLGDYSVTTSDFVDINSYCMGNIGTEAPAGDVTYSMYVSADATVTTADTRVNGPITPAASEFVSGMYQCGWAGAFQASNAGAGTWYVGIILDPSDDYAELDETNNVAVSNSPVVIN